MVKKLLDKGANGLAGAPALDPRDAEIAQLRAQLAESEARFKELAEIVPGVLYRWRQNHDGTLTPLYTSSKLHQIFGLLPGDVQNLGNLMHPDDRLRWQEATAVAVANGQPAPNEFEARLVVPGQPLRWWRSRALLALHDEQGIIHSGFMEDVTARRQQDEATRHGQMRQRLAGAGLGDGSWEYDYATQRANLSPEVRTMLGYAADELPDACFDWAAYSHPEDMLAVMEQWEACLSGDTPIFTIEHRLLCRNGTHLWVLNRGLITKHDDQGRPCCVTGIIIDISARKRSEAELTVSTLRLSTTIAGMQRGILLVDEQQKIVLTNPAFCRIFGFDALPDELIGLTDWQVAQQAKHNFSDESELLDFIADTILRQEPLFNNFVTLRDGRVLQRSFVPIRQADRSIGHLWTFEDITERYHAEQTLKRQEEKYRSIIDNMQLGLVETDLNHRVRYANESYCQMIGYPIEELLNQSIDSLLLPAEGLPALQAQRAERQRGGISSYEMEITTKRGEHKWLFIGAAPLYDSDRQSVGTIGINLDITRQKELEKNLREAKQLAEDSARAKELFLANMSHEIRTPMNAIMGMSQLLAKTNLVPRQSNYLHAITTSAQNLLVIINDILDLSKLDAGKMSIERVGFNVARLGEQVEKTLQYKAEEKGLQFVTYISPLIPNVVLGDPYRITQVLLNLASNSVKFTEKGKVIVECDVAGYLNGQVIIAFSVSDTGIGIDPQYLKNIFEEFSQEDTSITRKFGGTGLGLSISRSLVRLMGSELNIESEKNKGTSSFFCLALPIGTLHDLPQRKSVAISNPQELRGKHVLLVEDNEYNRLLAKTFLTNAGLEVTEAENGEAAVACVQQQSFDLILMDVQMPLMDGFEATQHLRQEMGITTPIIALTASAINGEKQKCLAAGMSDYLTKPFFEDELLQLVHDWVLRPPGSPSAVPVPAPAPAVVPASPALYKLDILLDTARGNQKFVLSMLQTFLDGTHVALRDLNHALEVGNVQGLQALAHKLRPSLVHLQIQPVVTLMDALENWDGPFSHDDLQPLVANSDRLLRQVLADMAVELDALRAGIGQEQSAR